MKSDRDIADEILAHAINNDIKKANATLGMALQAKRATSFRTHSAKYLVAIFCLAVICLGIDALDGHIIDHL